MAKTNNIRLIGIAGILAGIAAILLMPYSLIGVFLLVVGLIIVYYTGEGPK